MSSVASLLLLSLRTVCWLVLLYVAFVGISKPNGTLTRLDNYVFKNARDEPLRLSQDEL
jgi:hypothetical protein